MTDKTLAEQIRAMDNPEPGSLYSKGYSEALEDAAALADAAATTPVVGAEQAGDVRQAVSDEGPQMLPARFTCLGCKHLHTEGWEEEGDNDHWDSGVTALCQKANMRIDHYWYEKTATPDWCPCARITAALEPDPTPALSWRAMQTAAAGATGWEAHVIDSAPSYLSDWQRGLVAGQQAMRTAILALPGPSDAQALAEAVRLQEVKAMREALEWYGEQARLCRLIHSEWDAGRQALDRDGGKKATVVIAALAKIGGAA